MAEPSTKLKQVDLNEVSEDDDEVVLVTSVKELPETERVAEVEKESDAQINGTMVLTLLDKIIGVVDQIQQTQGALEARQQSMERAVMGIQGELAKLSKSHNGTTQTVNKMLEKVRKVNVNVKTVRSNLEKQAGQIKKLERNESELLKRRNFKVFIYQISMVCGSQQEDPALLPPSKALVMGNVQPHNQVTKHCNIANPLHTGTGKSLLIPYLWHLQALVPQLS
uniref:Caveolae associated protein 1 n=1 Tax=Paramormyrops kingsleyae TaxID=1676925 RepID=A0A3B3Q4Y0_9TELE